MRFFGGSLCFVLLAALSPRAAQAEVVGIGIAKSNSHVYAWFDDGTVSSGNSGNFALYSHPVGFSLPGNEQPKDVLAVSIAKNDHVYAWYRDGMTSEGTSGNLGKYKGLTPFQPAAGKSVADIRAIAIAGSNDRTYAWYADGTVSVGTSGRLDAHHPAAAVQLPPGRTTADLVEIDIAPDDRVYSWFADGTFFIGTSGVLAKHGGPGGYRSRRVIRAELAPGPHLIKIPHHPFLVGDQGVEGQGHPVHVLPPGTIGKAPPGDIAFREVGQKSTATLVNFKMQPAIGGQDAMVAVSPNFMILSDSGWLVFADRSAARLQKIPNGLETSLSSHDFFHQFFEAVDASGAPNLLNINGNAGFASNCNSTDFPMTTGDRFCLNEVYDTRVFFDSDSKRFFVVAHVRNPLQVSPDFASPGSSCGSFEAPTATPLPMFEGRTCIPHTQTTVRCAMHDRNLCGMARRYFLMAVSKTEDPRNGFFQFAVTENDYADFPWMAINRNRVVLASKGDTLEPPAWTEKEPVVLVFDKGALLAGSTQPPFFSYFPDDLSGETSMTLVTQPGGEGMTLMVNVGSKVRLFGFNASSDPWQAPPVIKAAIAIDGAPGGLNSVHRNGRLYLVGTKVVETVPNPADAKNPFKRRSVHLVRMPVTLTADDILVSKDSSAGFLDYFFGLNSPDDPPLSRFTYESPAIAVNKAGDMLFGYHRRPFANTSLLPDARVSFWPASADAPFASQLLRAGTGDPTDAGVDYSTAVIDPDDQSFWVAQPFGVAGAWNTAIGHLVP